MVIIYIFVIFCIFFYKLPKYLQLSEECYIDSNLLNIKSLIAKNKGGYKL